MNDITYVGLDVHKATVCVAMPKAAGRRCALGGSRVAAPYYSGAAAWRCVA